MSSNIQAAILLILSTDFYVILTPPPKKKKNPVALTTPGFTGTIQCQSSFFLMCSFSCLSFTDSFSFILPLVWGLLRTWSSGLFSLFLCVWSLPLSKNDNNLKRFTYNPDLYSALQTLHVRLPNFLYLDCSDTANNTSMIPSKICSC